VSRSSSSWPARVAQGPPRVGDLAGPYKAPTARTGRATQHERSRRLGAGPGGSPRCAPYGLAALRGNDHATHLDSLRSVVRDPQKRVIRRREGSSSQRSNGACSGSTPCHRTVDKVWHPAAGARPRWGLSRGVLPPGRRGLSRHNGPTCLGRAAHLATGRWTRCGTRRQEHGPGGASPVESFHLEGEA